MIGLNPIVEYVFLGGFLLSLLFYRKVSNQKLPLPLFLALAITVLLLVQRVTPTPRIWLYLEAFYLMFSAAGLVWLADLLVRSSRSKIAAPQLVERILSFAILLLFIGIFTNALLARQRDPVEMDRDRSPEETAYYLSLHGIPFERFYKRDHPIQIQNALVMVRKNSDYKTPESVVGFFKLDQSLDLSLAELVFEYASVQIYSIPAK